MSQFQDRVLDCADCGGTFVFTAGEQAFYQERGFSEPRRCPDCRSARKAGRSGGTRASSSRPSSDRGFSEPRGRGDRRPRQMYDAICADCGQETQVPFKPREDRPVYCRDCYQERQ